ncbi:unnamed protein product [Rotaria sp. Silwood1]|nr:unnamed protein product [Rotaria sp. Silwood1]CAF5154237.1 unnamed protein product [Rotaria sp. Silwood1]
MKDSSRTFSMSNDSQLIRGNDFYQPLSNSTRLESLKLINEAFQRFTKLESTLLAQRKQSQMTTSISSNRSRFNTPTNTNYNKNNEPIMTQTPS